MGQNVAIAGEPEGYLGLLGPLPEGISLAEAQDEPLDFAHTFVTAGSIAFWADKISPLRYAPVEMTKQFQSASLSCRGKSENRL